jgi:predicted permease
MGRIGESWRKLVFLLRRRQMDRDLAEEMRDHLERKTAKNAAAGMSGDEAHYAAQRQLGNLALQQEQSRSSWGFPFLESLVQDIHYAVRGLLKAPGFSVVAILTLALGIGAVTAIFSIANTVILRPLPYNDSRRLLQVWTITAMFPDFSMGNSKPKFDDIRARAHAFETQAIYQPLSLSLLENGEPEQIRAAAVSSDFLTLFAVKPALGRSFHAADEEAGSGKVVLLSYGLWQRRFASDPNVLGRPITLDHELYTVAGVLPSGFSYPKKTDAFVPLVITGKDRVNRAVWKYFMLARLRPSVSLDNARAEMADLAAQFGRENPTDEAGNRFDLVPLQNAAVGRSTTFEVALLAGAVAFLLLIGCANVSNLILSRSLQRRKEIALRAALGASRMRILRQLFIESLPLALAGGFVGMLLAGWAVGVFRTIAPAGFARLDEVRLEPAVALIALMVSSLAGVLCGLAPALHASRADLNLAMDRTPSAAPQRFSLRSFLVVSEVSLALVLLTGAGLMVQSFVRVMKIDTGFRTDHLLTAEMALSTLRYPSEDTERLLVQRLLEALKAEPQFSRVAIANSPMMTGNISIMTFDPEAMGIHEKKTTLESNSVSPGFFEAMGIPFIAGRWFDDRDTKGSARVAVINQSFARRFFPGQDPLGKTLKLGSDPEDQYQVVGIVADTRDIQLRAKAWLQVYFSLLQKPQGTLHLMVRSSVDPLTLAKVMQQRVWSVDKDEPLTKVTSMTQVIAESVAEPRFRTWLLSSFAAAGLALTLIGIYGVISYSVSQRTRELGIRIALGAQAGDVRRLVLKQGFRLALIGAIIGMLGSLGLMRLLASQLYEIKPSDPVTLVGAAMLILAVSLCASYIPSWRATKVDPMVALRHE